MKRLLVCVLWAAVAAASAAFSMPADNPGAPGAAPAGGGAEAGKGDDEGRPPQADPRANCSNKRILSFTRDASGNVSDKGKSVEGPVCIVVYFNPLQGAVSISSVEARVAGPDLSAAILGKAAPGGAPGAEVTRAPTPKQLSVAFGSIETRFYKEVKPRLDAVPGQYATALEAQGKAVTDIKALLNSTIGVDPGTPALSDTVNNYFSIALNRDFNDAQAKQNTFFPTDKRQNQSSTPLLAQLQEIRNQLASLPFDYAGGATNAAGPWQCVGENPENVVWSQWYAKSDCKDLYVQLQKAVDDAITTAQQYATGADLLKALQAKASIVNYWIGRFAELGLKVGSDQKSDLLKLSQTQRYQGCGTIFNQSSTTTLSLVTIDQTPTLDGNPPAVKTQDAFMTVTCGTRFSVGAGVGFSTIRQQEFAIVKSAGGQNNTSINKFGTLSDSRLHPLPMALVHARLGETPGHLIAVHATVGIAGNLQGQASGGSSAEFLLGGSLSFLRTVYFSAGLHIGTKAELAGGFAVGDTVPTDITAIQVKRSYTTGFGFAVSFGK